jgi:hypothetical protein
VGFFYLKTIEDGRLLRVDAGDAGPVTMRWLGITTQSV